MRYFSYLVVAIMIFGVALTSCKDNEDNPREFIVSFETGDGATAVAPQKVKEGEKVSKPKESPTRSGFEFVAWYKEVELISEWNFETDVVTANMTLYAKWQQNNVDNPKEFTVSFETGDGGSAIAPQKVKEGEKVTKPEESPTRDGYEFVTWYKEVDLINEWDFETDVVIADVTLYAKWEQKKEEQNMYDIIVSCEGNGTASANVTSAMAGESVTLTATANRGYRFDKWWVIEGGIPFSYTTDNPFTFIMPNRDFEVKAIFDENIQNIYSITVLSGENGTASASVTSAYMSEVVTLTATANSGYSFVGWQIIKGDIYLLNTIDNPLTFLMPGMDVEVKAIFVPFAGLLGSIIFSENNYQTKYNYEFDSKNLFTKCNGNDYSLSRRTLNYNTVGDLIEYSAKFIMPRNPSSATSFSKRFDKVFFITTTYLPRGSKNVYGEIELNAQGLPIKLVTENSERYMGVAGDWSHTTVSLTWQNGNLTKADWEREDDKSSSAGTVTYTHDDKKTPFHNCNTPKWVLWWLNYCSWDGYWENYRGMNYGYNENNIITETREVGSTITYEYTYNDDGFPVSRTWVDEASTYSETYTYK